jgi:hypothetical protein
LRTKLADLPNQENKEDILNYIFNFPSDFGGVGEVYEDEKYENLNFFDYKTKSKQLPCTDINQFIPLEMSHSNALHKPVTMPQPNVINYYNPVNQYMIYNNPVMMNEYYRRMMYEAELAKK